MILIGLNLCIHYCQVPAKCGIGNIYQARISDIRLDGWIASLSYANHKLLHEE